MSETDHLLAGAPPILCECSHFSMFHADGSGRCSGLDSYGCPCECPSLIEWADDYEEEEDYS